MCSPAISSSVDESSMKEGIADVNVAPLAYRKPTVERTLSFLFFQQLKMTRGDEFPSFFGSKTNCIYLKTTSALKARCLKVTGTAPLCVNRTLLTGSLCNPLLGYTNKAGIK